MTTLHEPSFASGQKPLAAAGVVTVERAPAQALEATAYQTYDLVEAMLADTGVAQPGELRVDEGMTRNDLLMQVQADVLGSPVAAPAVTEITATGAAYAAG